MLMLHNALLMKANYTAPGSTDNTATAERGPDREGEIPL